MSARIGLGRSGVSMPTSRLLAMAADLALARDAVRASFDAEHIAADLRTAAIESVIVSTAAHDREDYLRRPDHGRVLSQESARELASMNMGADLALIVSDGLSATAANRHAVSLLRALLADLSVSVAPVVIAPLARVGLLNDVGAALGTRSAAIVLGERPGSSAPDSLSLYFEMSPTSGLTDADRNCISNIRPGGLPVEIAALQAAALIQGGLRAGISGTGLKLEYDDHREVGPVTGID